MHGMLQCVLDSTDATVLVPHSMQQCWVVRRHKKMKNSVRAAK